MKEKADEMERWETMKMENELQRIYATKVCLVSIVSSCGRWYNLSWAGCGAGGGPSATLLVDGVVARDDEADPASRDRN